MTSWANMWSTFTTIFYLFTFFFFPLSPSWSSFSSSVGCFDHNLNHTNFNFCTKENHCPYRIKFIKGAEMTTRFFGVFFFLNFRNVSGYEGNTVMTSTFSRHAVRSSIWLLFFPPLPFGKKSPFIDKAPWMLIFDYTKPRGVKNWRKKFENHQNMQPNLINLNAVKLSEAQIVIKLINWHQNYFHVWSSISHVSLLPQ